MNAFDQFLADTRKDPGSTHWRGPVIDVADTMVVCKKWFEAHGVAFTVADLLAMTELVLEREQALAKAEEET